MTLCLHRKMEDIERGLLWFFWTFLFGLESSGVEHRKAFRIGLLLDSTSLLFCHAQVQEEFLVRCTQEYRKMCKRNHHCNNFIWRDRNLLLWYFLHHRKGCFRVLDLDRLCRNYEGIPLQGGFRLCSVVLYQLWTCTHSLYDKTIPLPT